MSEVQTPFYAFLAVFVDAEKPFLAVYSNKSDINQNTTWHQQTVVIIFKKVKQSPHRAISTKDSNQNHSDEQSSMKSVSDVCCLLTLYLLTGRSEFAGGDQWTVTATLPSSIIVSPSVKLLGGSGLVGSANGNQQMLQTLLHTTNNGTNQYY